MNKKKLTGLLLSVCGVFCARIELFIPIQSPEVALVLKIVGVTLALAGICMFAAGINILEKKVTVCSICHTVIMSPDGICTTCTGGAETNTHNKSACSK
ncbi:MAG: hypothetical protein N3B18_02525 [Desulfobacterota bacterium]|nr:hypothetical protein [Thermodesulfobacteriota bacterium]